MTKQELRGLLSEENVLLLDGAMGTNLYKAGMPKGCCVEEWELTYPEVVLKLQKAYVDAGARILYAPTFGANRVRLGKFGLSNRITEFNERLVDLSRQAAADQAYVAGDIASTGILLEELGGDVSGDELFEIRKLKQVCVGWPACRVS